MDRFLFKNEVDDEKNGNGSNKDKTHIFGCANKETGEFFNQQADGIIGFGSEELRENSSNPPNIIETEKYENRIKEKSFSLCFGHNGGELTFGGWNSYLHLNGDDPKRFSTIKTDSLGKYAWSSQYRVPVYSVLLDGQKIEYEYEKMNKGRTFGEGAFLDSGTTFIYVASDFYNKLKIKMENYCSSSHDKCGYQSFGLDCYKYNSNDNKSKKEFFDSFPTITFDFHAEKLYHIHPEDYLVKLDATEEYCVGIKALKNMILGGVFWRNYDIQINKTTKTVGFARADCDKSGGVSNKADEDEKGATKNEDKPSTTKEHEGSVKNTNWNTTKLHSESQTNYTIIVVLVVFLVIFIIAMICLGKYLLY
jgi:hypothetical protein